MLGLAMHNKGVSNDHKYVLVNNTKCQWDLTQLAPPPL